MALNYSSFREIQFRLSVLWNRIKPLIICFVGRKLVTNSRRHNGVYSKLQGPTVWNTGWWWASVCCKCSGNRRCNCTSQYLSPMLPGIEEDDRGDRLSSLSSVSESNPVEASHVCGDQESFVQEDIEVSSSWSPILITWESATASLPSHLCIPSFSCVNPVLIYYYGIFF